MRKSQKKGKSVAPIVPIMTIQPDIEEEVQDLDEALEVIPYTYSITAYGADYPVDGVVKRIEANDIVVPTFSWEPGTDSKVVGFQREYVWPRPKADRFIESLLLGLPVPGIFLVKENSGRLLVLDGHQRLYTLRAFYEGVINGVEYKLGDVQKYRSPMKDFLDPELLSDFARYLCVLVSGFLEQAAIEIALEHVLTIG